jgi:hypothetical protein
MKYILKSLIATLLIFTTFSGRSQSAFQNLDFEAANVSPSGYELYGTFVPIGSALPDWTAYLGGEQITQVGYNSTTLGTATISLIGPTWNSSDVSLYGFGIISGNYSVVLETGAVPTNTALGAQNATVPSTAEWLQFEAYAYGPFSVSFAGNALDPIALSSGVSADGLPYTVYGVNISAWAGQTGILEFATGDEYYDPYLELDDITFSTTAVVPEPSVLALMVMGGLAFGARRWRAKGDEVAKKEPMIQR